MFTVRFPDREVKDIVYNVLAEHLYSQVDFKGNQHKLFSGLIGHRKRSSAVVKVDGYRMVNGNKVRKRATTRMKHRGGVERWYHILITPQGSK